MEISPEQLSAASTEAEISFGRDNSKLASEVVLPQTSFYVLCFRLLLVGLKLSAAAFLYLHGLVGCAGSCHSLESLQWNSVINSFYNFSVFLARLCFQVRWRAFSLQMLQAAVLHSLVLCRCHVQTKSSSLLQPWRPAVLGKRLLSAPAVSCHPLKGSGILLTDEKRL